MRARGHVVKRFIVFAGNDYYPGGGWHDFHSDHDMAEDAVKAADQAVHERHEDWSHVVDASTGEEIYTTPSARSAQSPKERA